MQLTSLFWRARGRAARRAQPTGNHKYVFVVTYGRSGSTLIQGLLNTLPRTLVRGENDLYVLPLFRAMAVAESFKLKHVAHGSRKTSSAFFGLHEIQPSEFVESTHDLMVRQLFGSVDPSTIDHVGFKEVQWNRIRPGETERFFTFFDQVFPGAKYVLNQREHAQVSGSGFWRKREKDEVMQALVRTEKIHEHLRRTRPDRVYDTRYELVTSPDPAVVEKQLRGLAEFVLGSCDDELLARLKGTLTKGHGPNPFGRSRTSPPETAS
jgi:hypothetical protein